MQRFFETWGHILYGLFLIGIVGYLGYFVFIAVKDVGHREARIEYEAKLDKLKPMSVKAIEDPHYDIYQTWSAEEPHYYELRFKNG